MQNDVVAVTVKGVMPTDNGCAVFLGEDSKTFVIYVDHSVGKALDALRIEHQLFERWARIARARDLD